MIPTRRQRSVSPRDADIETGLGIIIGKDITPEISTYEKFVFVREFIIQFGIQIIKEITAAFERRTRADERLQQDINVSAATGNDERTFLLFDGALDGEARRNHTYSALGMKFLIVAFLHRNIKDRGKATTILCRHSALD